MKRKEKGKIMISDKENKYILIEAEDGGIYATTYCDNIDKIGIGIEFEIKEEEKKAVNVKKLVDD